MHVYIMYVGGDVEYSRSFANVLEHSGCSNAKPKVLRRPLQRRRDTHPLSSKRRPRLSWVGNLVGY